MARPPGRDQSAPMERLVRLIGVLIQHPTGAPVDLLMRVMDGPEATEESRRKMLARDVAQLNALGYDIRNVAEPGAGGRYLMRARDNRLQVHLTAEQRGELLRAARAAGLEGMTPHLGVRTGPPSSTTSSTRAGSAQQALGGDRSRLDHLDLVQRAVTRHCLIRFTYKGLPRLAHPVRVHSGPSGWYLSAREVDQDVVKEFVVSRMDQVTLDPPGSAEAVRGETRPSLDPLSWQVDAPVDVVIEVPPEHRLLVTNLLGHPADETEGGERPRLTYVVTNRAVFRWRIYELGTRVRLVSPEEIRAEIVAELESFLAPERR